MGWACPAPSNNVTASFFARSLLLRFAADPLVFVFDDPLNDVATRVASFNQIFGPVGALG
jgi:hypothetical protein